MRNMIAGIAVGILLAGWVASVGIRSWNKVSVEIVPEIMGAAMASGLLWSKITGSSAGGPGEDSP